MCRDMKFYLKCQGLAKSSENMSYIIRQLSVVVHSDLGEKQIFNLGLSPRSGEIHILNLFVTEDLVITRSSGFNCC